MHRKGAHILGIGGGPGLQIIQVCLCGGVGGCYTVMLCGVAWCFVGVVGIWRLFVRWACEIKISMVNIKIALRKMMITVIQIRWI